MPCVFRGTQHIPDALLSRPPHRVKSTALFFLLVSPTIAFPSLALGPGSPPAAVSQVKPAHRAGPASTSAPPSSAAAKHFPHLHSTPLAGSQASPRSHRTSSVDGCGGFGPWRTKVGVQSSGPVRRGRPEHIGSVSSPAASVTVCDRGQPGVPRRGGGVVTSSRWAYAVLVAAQGGKHAMATASAHVRRLSRRLRP